MDLRDRIQAVHIWCASAISPRDFGPFSHRRVLHARDCAGALTLDPQGREGRLRVYRRYARSLRVTEGWEWADNSETVM
jgi:hypothetical protein